MKLKVLHVHPHFTTPSGAGRFVMEVSKGLAKHGWQSNLVTQYVGAPWKRQGAIDVVVELGGPLPSSPVHWYKWPKWTSGVGKAVHDLSPDVVLAHAFPANWWAMNAKHRFGDTPLVWMCHEPSAFVHNLDHIRGLSPLMRTLATGARPFTQRIDRRLARNVNAWIANSKWTQREIQRIYGAVAAVAYPGVEQGPPGSSDRKDFLTAARWSRFKRLDILLEAFAHYVKKTAAPIRLRVAGDGPDLGRCSRLAKRLGIENQVVFLGEVDADILRQEYRSCLAFVMASSREPFGIVAAEAMAAGAPVIVPSNSGAAELIDDGITGFLAGDATVAELSAAFDRTLGRGHELRSMGEAARTTTQALTWDACAASVDRVMRSTLS